MDNQITNEELNKLDFFALQTLTKSMLAFVIADKPELEQHIAELFEKSVYNFQFYNNPHPIKDDAARQYMLEQGHQWIPAAANLSKR